MDGIGLCNCAIFQTNCRVSQIDVSVVSSIDVNQLQPYLFTHGLRLFAIDAAKKIINKHTQNKVASEGNIKKDDLTAHLKSKLLDYELKNINTRARKRGLCEKLDTNAEGEASSSKTAYFGNKNATRNTRVVKIGWKTYDAKKETYSQVRERRGGGTREVHLNKQWIKSDILVYARNLFFADEGKNLQGEHFDEFELEIVDSKDQKMSENLTLADMYKKLEDVGLHTLICYLTTKKKTTERIEKVSSPSVQILRVSSNNPGLPNVSKTSSLGIPSSGAKDVPIRGNVSKHSTDLTDTGPLKEAAPPTLAYDGDFGNSSSASPNIPQIPSSQIVFNKNVDVIGRGAFGTVYKGMWAKTEVAIKEIKIKRRKTDSEATITSLTADIQKEVHLNGLLRHPNIATLMAFSIDSHAVYLVSELIKGYNLDELLFDSDCTVVLTDCNKVNIAKNIVSALCYMHTMNVIHQDIKPANVLVDFNFKAKLCDFGLGRVRKAHATSHSYARGIVGTVCYMAPECLIGSQLHKGTQQSDVWSMGCTIVELFTEQLLWGPRSNEEEYVMACMQDKAQPLAVQRIEKRYHALAVGCVNYDPDSRISATQIMDVLDQIQ